jgi:hypothetical protein
MEQLDLFDVFGNLNEVGSDKKRDEKETREVDCEFYFKGKCHAIEDKEEECTCCWLCQ